MTLISRGTETDRPVIVLTVHHTDGSTPEIPFETFLETATVISPLASALRTAFTSLSAYPFSTTLRIAHLPLYIQLPLPPPPADVDWAWFEDLYSHTRFSLNHQRGDNSGMTQEDYDELDDLEFSGTGAVTGGVTAGEWSWMRIEPWKALLIVDEEAEAAVQAEIDGEGGIVEGDRPAAPPPSTNAFSDLWEEDEPEHEVNRKRDRDKSRSTSGTFTFMDHLVGEGKRRGRSREASTLTLLAGNGIDGGNAVGESVVAGAGGGEEEGSEEDKSGLYRMFIDAARPSRR